MPTKRPTKPRKAEALFLGVGLDGEPGERRITKGRDFLLVGGSPETHERLTERAVKVDEELDRRGMRLADVRSRDEMIDVLQRAWR